MEIIRILSDYTPSDQPNLLLIIADDQGDIHINLHKDVRNDERGVRIAASGTRHSVRVRRAWQAFIKAYKEEILDAHCHPGLRKCNKGIINDAQEGSHGEF